jgi:DNA-directed RNA polymerase specialized sigma24 family protein
MRTSVKIEDAFDNYHRAVFDFVYRLGRRADLAEDITQECFRALNARAAAL